MQAGGIFAVVLTAVVLFAATNVDDIVILTVLCISSRASGQPRPWHIWAGQYAGFAVLIGASLAAAAGLALVPLHWLWLLGLVPLGLGLHKLATAIRAHASDRTSTWGECCAWHRPPRTQMTSLRACSKSSIASSPRTSRSARRRGPSRRRAIS